MFIKNGFINLKNKYINTCNVKKSCVFSIFNYFGIFKIEYVILNFFYFRDLSPP